MAELKIIERHADNKVTILDCSGKVTIGEGAVILNTVVKDLVKRGHTKILLDVGNVSYVDSSGIQQLVKSFTDLNKTGGQLKLLNISQKLSDLLAITKLLTVFECYESEAEGITSFD